MDNNFFGSVPRDYGKPSLTIFWFQENSWEPCFFLRGGANQGDGRPNETRGASLKGEWGGGGGKPGCLRLHGPDSYFLLP